MSNEHVADTSRARVHEDENMTSKGNNVVLSVVLFLVLFGLFVVTLYVATDRLSWLVIGAVMFLPPAVFAAQWRQRAGATAQPIEPITIQPTDSEPSRC